MRNQTWADFVRIHRLKLNLTKRELGSKASIDPSYVTLVERDGHVPKREIVERIAKALGVNIDNAFFAAGYVRPEAIKSARAIYGELLKLLEDGNLTDQQKQACRALELLGKYRGMFCDWRSQ